ncbi:hypothetical protein [uncultured Mediterranean phage uvMED]|nr:hypothetical protein [uncultured Mediterranean phage uvMED]
MTIIVDAPILPKGFVIDSAIQMAGLYGNFRPGMDDFDNKQLLTQLDLMMAKWDAEGLQIGYILSAGTPKPEDPSGLADGQVKAVATNLVYDCFRIFGLDQVDLSDLRLRAEEAKEGLYIACTDGYQQEPNPYLPTGAGIEQRDTYNNAYFVRDELCATHCSCEGAEDDIHDECCPRFTRVQVETDLDLNKVGIYDRKNMTNFKIEQERIGIVFSDGTPAIFGDMSPADET